MITDRPGYDGMGLGLFIAKTLLERSGAKLGFSNGIGSDNIGGAIVSVNWPSKKLVVDAPAFGKNELIEV